MKFNPGFDIKPLYDPLGFEYGQNVFGPIVENRSLDAIRKNLMDPDCTGPDIVYTIAMDVGRKEDQENMLKRNLLYGVVTYAKGKLGKEPVRSQGHIHAISPSCQMSTCEVYEIWTGGSIHLYARKCQRLSRTMLCSLCRTWGCCHCTSWMGSLYDCGRYSSKFNIRCMVCERLWI